MTEHRRPTKLAAVSVALLAVLPSCSVPPFSNENSAPQIDDIAGEPVPLDEPVLIAEGEVPGGLPWTLSGVRTDDGLCLDLEGVMRGNLGGGGCGFDAPGAHAVSIVTSSFADPAVTMIFGPVDSQVEEVRITLGNGRDMTVSVIPSPEGLDFDGGFFVARLPGAGNVDHVVALGPNGQIVERREP